MILVDSCVWIDFFRGATTRAVELLDAQSGRDRFVVGDLVVTEVLQGFGDDREFRRARDILYRFPVITVSDRRVAVQAAELYRDLRKRGITVRKTIDTLIAARCVADDIALLSSDSDFAPFHAHCRLRDALAEA